MIGAIIQARMTSTRLPGKVLKTVLGRPVIDYLFQQLNHVPSLNIKVLATTTNPADDPLVEYAKTHQIPCFRGSEQDVLERYYQAACQFGIQHVVRITSDCPLLDPRICEQVIQKYMNESIDFVHTGETVAEGLDCEIFTFKALETAYQTARLKHEREHVTLFLHNHPELFKKITFHNPTDDSHYRFTIDEPEDFQVFEKIVEALPLKTGEFYRSEVIKSFIDKNSEIMKINSKIIRNEGLIKSLAEEKLENAKISSKK
ncbi:glycosyltransferase family protein [Deltaproteobacteria bacterium TL4]